MRSPGGLWKAKCEWRAIGNRPYEMMRLVSGN